jgi:hypothetical protein
VDDVANTDEMRSKAAYEPPRLDELGSVDELTQLVAGSVTDNADA